MHSTTLSAAALLLTGLRVVNAQTFTDCNPLSSTTCPTDPALGTTLTTDFTSGASDDWSLADGTTLTYGSDGAEFAISTKTGAPTISSDKYIFFGKVDAVLKAAPGTGIVSSFILESDDLDEIDWEWLGSTDTSVESNFFGKGNTTTYDRAIYHTMSDPIGSYHTYTIDWTAESIKWSIDGNLVRTLTYGDALALGGKNYPQTPMKVKMGNWVGCPDEAANQPSSSTYGTCQWAGGPAVFTSGASYTMLVKSVTIQDYSCGSEYAYGDTSGSYESIQIKDECDGKTSPSSVGSSAKPSATSSVSSTSGGIFVQTSTGSSAVSTGTAATTLSTSGKTTIASVTSTGTSGTSPSATSATPSAVTANAASTLTPKTSKFGALDFTVIALGLTLGYFVM